MTAATALAPLLTPAEIEQLEAETRADLTSAIVNLTRLREADAHQVRGYATWHSYVLDRFGDLLRQLRLPRPERLALVASMDDAGMTVTEIQERLGVARGTVQNDRAALGRVIPIGPRRKPEPAPHPPAGKVYQQAAEWLRRAQLGLIDGIEHGLTLVELAELTGWTEGKSSGALTYLRDRGLAVRLEDRRAGQRVHVLTDTGAAAVAARVTVGLATPDPRS